MSNKITCLLCPYTMAFSLESRFERGVSLVKSLGGKLSGEKGNNLIDTGEEAADTSIAARSQNAIRKVFNQLAANITQSEGFSGKFRNIKSEAQKRRIQSRKVITNSLLRYYQDFKKEVEEHPTVNKIELLLRKGHRLVANSGKLIAMLFSSGQKIDLLV